MKMAVWQIKKRKSRKFFTLVEMLVAMAILSLLMLLLFRFLAAGQNVWSMSQTNTRIYENARVAMELVQRELKTAIVSNIPDREIPFIPGDEDTPTEFVTATGLASSDADSKLCTVEYYDNNNVLLRNAANAIDGSTDGEQEVINGVEDFSMVCFHSNGSEFTAAEVGNKRNTLPAYVIISLTLYDAQLDDIPSGARNARKQQTMRTFTKTVYLKQD